MKPEYDKPAKLMSWPADKDASHGNPQKEGTLAQMVKLGMESLANGDVGVMVVYDHGTYHADDIKKIAALPDFPK